MSSYVYMKVLESAPHRYDRGIRMLSRGRIDEVYETIALRVAAPGRRILDIGCGTGGVSIACAARGAHVVGIDINAEMLEVARSKSAPAETGGSVEWIQLGAIEIEDEFGEGDFDAAVSCLVFSELSPAEREYVLNTVRARLKAGGMLATADEVRPETVGRRFWHRARRLPLAIATYILTQTTTRPVEDLARLTRDAGYCDVEELRLPGGDFAIVFARVPEETDESA